MRGSSILFSIIVLVIVFTMSVLTGCEQAADDFQMEPRITLEYNGVYFGARVFVENGDGLAVSGAVVYVISPSNTLTLLEFDYDRGCYAGQPGVPQSGGYLFTVDSSALGVVEREVPFQVITGIPTITSLASDNGNEVLMGADIPAHSAAAISWEPVTGASLYRVEMQNSQGAVIQISATEETLLLGADKFEFPGNYSIFVAAQYIAGDPYFSSSSFYSVNQCAGSRLYFEVE